MKTINSEISKIKEDLIHFTQNLVKIKSYSGQEEEIITFIEKHMKVLGYDEIKIDTMGNLIGRIGNGRKKVMFDSHVDTVEVTDEKKWDVPPFSGTIIDEYLFGRGSVDMKSGAAASIYAGAIAKNSKLDSDKTIYVSCTVLEEDCEGENLKYVFNELNLKPDYMIICEPSGNTIACGHKGKAQLSIKTKGVPAHASAPEKGKNAIYEMAEIIQRVEKKNAELMKKGDPKGTLVMSRISSISESLNAVPSECKVHLDRRIIPGETEQSIKKEMEQIIQSKNATWEIKTIHTKSWTGKDINYKAFHVAWKIDLNHELLKICNAAYTDTFGSHPEGYEFWDFSTNAVTPVSMGIPTIGFGPGEYKLAHMNNEHCRVNQIIDACRFYTSIIHNI